MATFLFDKVVFGPVRSRRLGNSLGINLLPGDRKWCTFNCIYCECGWTDQELYDRERFAPREIVRGKLKEKLILMMEREEKPDTITFAGNGEPTLHPSFGAVIEDTVLLRDRFARGAKIAVLSNGTMLDDPNVFSALEMVDMNILKIDSAREETAKLMNQPAEGFSYKRLVENIMRFKGRFILQTMFIRGVCQGRVVDNATEEELRQWLQLVRRLRPQMVMVYTIARDTPAVGLHKIPAKELHRIAARVQDLGIAVQISE